MYIYIYSYVNMYMYIYMYVCIYMYMYLTFPRRVCTPRTRHAGRRSRRKYVYTCIHTYTSDIHVYTRTHPYIHIFICKYIYVYIHVHVHTYISPFLGVYARLGLETLGEMYILACVICILMYAYICKFAPPLYSRRV